MYVLILPRTGDKRLIEPSGTDLGTRLQYRRIGFHGRHDRVLPLPSRSPHHRRLDELCVVPLLFSRRR